VGFSSEIERKGKKSRKNSKTFEMKKLGGKKKKKKPVSKSIKHNPNFLIKKPKAKESHGGAGPVVVD
jgi:hypothetical protein